jgi:Xaa-Pro aminopeptidase
MLHPSLGICLALTALAVSAPLASRAEEAQGRDVVGVGAVLPHRQRAAVVNEILEERLARLLPDLMRETDIDMWLVINREYAEDPVYLTLVPEPVFSARRTTMLVFFDRGEQAGLERLTVSRYPLQGLYEPAWKGGSREDQWTRLAEIVRERNPERIGVNVSRDWAFGDGLSAGLRQQLGEALGPELEERVVSAEELCVRWLETRTPRELEIYAHAVALARGVIAEAFSSRAITPGATTADDVRWYVRERFEELGLDPWFHPDVNVQRQGVDHEPDQPFFGDGDAVIRRGDVLHTDVGICYLRLCTDTQEMGYVLRVGEEDVPAGLREALAVGNRWQDLLTGNFAAGRSGNEILAAAHAATDVAEITDRIYTHPIGHFGHAPGPTIGMWDDQGLHPVHGDWTLRPRTCYAIEGNVKVPVPEWGGQLVQIKLEQSAAFDAGDVRYLAGRQTTWHVVR